MKAKEFLNKSREESSKDYGLCPPPTSAQAGLNVLIEHFLGKDWCVTMSMGAEQVNTAAIFEILEKYPDKKSIKEKFAELKTLLS